MAILRSHVIRVGRRRWLVSYEGLSFKNGRVVVLENGDKVGTADVTVHVERVPWWKVWVR